MNVVWAALLGVSVVTALALGRGAELTGALTGAGERALGLLLTIAGVMIIWTGLLRVAEKSGLMRRTAALLKPALRLLFPRVPADSEAAGAIAVNVAANVLGLGNAATPSGLRAMALLRETEGKDGRAGPSLAMLVVLNTASVQLIPTTVAALRASAGSAEPFSILPAVWLTSVVSVAAGVLSAKLFERVWPT